MFGTQFANFNRIQAHDNYRHPFNTSLITTSAKISHKSRNSNIPLITLRNFLLVENYTYPYKLKHTEFKSERTKENIYESAFRMQKKTPKCLNDKNKFYFDLLEGFL